MSWMQKQNLPRRLQRRIKTFYAEVRLVCCRDKHKLLAFGSQAAVALACCCWLLLCHELPCAIPSPQLLLTSCKLLHPFMERLINS